MEARLSYIQKVAGSNPVLPTKNTIHNMNKKSDLEKQLTLAKETCLLQMSKCKKAQEYDILLPILSYINRSLKQLYIIQNKG